MVRGYEEVKVQLAASAEAGRSSTSYWVAKLEGALFEDQVAELEAQITSKTRSQRQAQSDATVDCTEEGSSVAAECQTVRKLSEELSELEKRLADLRVENKPDARVKANEAARIRRVHAAYALSRRGVDAATAVKAFLVGIRSADSVVRDVSLFGLARHGRRGDIEALEKIQALFEARLEGVSNPDNDPLTKTIFTIKLLRAHLSRKS